MALNSKNNILLVWETKAEETRVALVPSDVKKLVEIGHKVYVEHNAGMKSGFTDDDYNKAGASIRKIDYHSSESYKKLFEEINIIARAKRPCREREMLESKAIVK